MYSGKILILLPIWKRKNITKLCLKYLKRLQEERNIDVLCVVSEVWAKIEAFEHGFKWVEVSNDDLGKKMNKGIETAMTMDFDYLMNLGSDDIINSRLFDVYDSYFKEGKGIFGITKVTFIDSESKEVKQNDYKAMIGAGRCIRKDLISKYVIRGKKSIMYDEGIEMGLDNNSIKKFDCSHAEIDGGDNLIWDIKGQDNIWKYNDLGGYNTDFETAVKEMTTEQIDDILAL